MGYNRTNNIFSSHKKGIYKCVTKKKNIYIKRQPSDHRIGKALFEDLNNIHWDNISGGIHARSGQDLLYGNILCNKIIGNIGHSCLHGKPPHNIKVFIPIAENDPKTVKELKAIADKNGIRHSSKKPFNIADKIRKDVLQNPGITPADIYIHIGDCTKKEIDNAIRYLKKNNFKRKKGLISEKYKNTQKLYIK